MTDFLERLDALDTGIFAAVPTQTCAGDRRSLLRVQREARQSGRYTYLEIGSHLGGTIQPHYADPACEKIFSIDKRPLEQPDERGRNYAYPENSTRTMLANLARVHPRVDAAKVVSFDASVAELDPAVIDTPPDICLIDGEHTNSAAMADFLFCDRVAAPGALILMHDACVTFEAIKDIQALLAAREGGFAGMKLGGSVYAFARGGGLARWTKALEVDQMDEAAYFFGARLQRRRSQTEARLSKLPPLARLYRWSNAFQDAAYKIYARLFKRIRP